MGQVPGPPPPPHGLEVPPSPCGVVWWMEGNHLTYGKGVSMVNLLQRSLDLAIMVA